MVVTKEHKIAHFLINLSPTLFPFCWSESDSVTQKLWYNLNLEFCDPLQAIAWFKCGGLNQNVMTIVAFLAYAAGPLSIKSHQITPTESW